MKHEHIEIPSHVGIGGEFRAVLQNSDGSIAYDSGWNHNQIQDNGLFIYGDTAQNAWYTKCWAGSSNTGLPPVTQTAMTSVLGESTSSSEGSPSTPSAGNNYVRSQIKTYVFPAGVATGTVRQIAIGPTSTSMFAIHVLPAAIVKAVNQTLNVSYRFNMYPSLVSNTVSAVIGGVTYDCESSFFELLFDNYSVFREAAVANGNNNYTGCYTGVAATLEEVNPAGSYLGGTQTIPSIVYGTGFIDYTYLYSINQANGTIRTAKSYLSHGNFFTQTQFTATDGAGIGGGIPKGSEFELTLSRRTTWGRYTP